MSKKKLTTHIVFVQDETGSMQPIKDDTVGGFNEYFETINDEIKSGVTCQVWQFSDAAGEERVRLFHSGSLKGVAKLNAKSYRPRGSTPLLDAVGTALQQAEDTKADRYIFVVQTDGQENSSKDFDLATVQKMFKEKEEADNWTIVFLGSAAENWDWRETYTQLGLTTRSSGIGARSENTSPAYSSISGQTVSLLNSDDTRSVMVDEQKGN